MAKLLPILIIALILWLLFFHGSLPGMGRRTGRGLRDIKDAGREILDGEEVPNSPLARYEFQAGRAVTARVLAENPLAADAAVQDRVLRIGRQLASRSARREVRYRFAVLDDDEPKAMAIPGGSVFLTRGLVALCGPDDSRLAGVLAHEMAHIECRHAAKSYATRALAQTGVRLATLGRGALIARLAGGVQDLIAEGYTHDRELEADRAGALLAQAAGFRREGLSELLRWLAESCPAATGVPAEAFPFFRSHPPLAERLEALRSV